MIGPMLRLLVLSLLVANAAFYAWHQGWLDDAIGLRAQGERDPARLGQEVNPDQLIVLGAAPSAASAASVASVASDTSVTTPPVAASTEPESPGSDADAALSNASAASVATRAAAQCLEAGPFTAEEHRNAQGHLSKVLPAHQWSTQTVSVPGLWLVYMGPYPDEEQLRRKESELRRIRNLPFEEVRSPSSLAQGISLGKYTDERLANSALETLRVRGIRTARVVNARPSMELQVIKAPSVNDTQRATLAKLPLPAGKGFIDCGG